MVITGGLVLGFQDTLVKAFSTYTSYWQFLAIRSTLNPFCVKKYAVVTPVIPAPITATFIR